MPLAPAFMALARFTYEPGAFFPPSAGPGPVVIHVEAGSLTFNSEKEVILTRGTRPSEAIGGERVTPQTEFTVVAGDQLNVPGDTPHSARSNGPGPAATLGVAIFPSAPKLEFPPGVNFHPLILGASDVLPPAPARVRLQRLTFYPGQPVNLSSCCGPKMLYVESGSLGVTAKNGPLQISRPPKPGTPPGPPGPPELAKPYVETILYGGEGAVVPTGVVPALRNAGRESLTMLEAAIDYQGS